MMPASIHDYIVQEENRYETTEIRVGDNWMWNMRKHVQLIFHLKNGVFYTGENNWMRTFKAVMEPVLDLAYWTEDIDVKDVLFFVEGDDDRVLSMLLKKYHDQVYVREHDLDTLFDEITESDVDYGGVIVQPGKGRPEVVPLNAVAFCDQTNITGGPIGIKLNFSPDKLRGMASAGWGKESNGATMDLDTLCTLAGYDKDVDGTLQVKKNETTGKVVEVYLVKGSLPEHYLKDNNNMDDHYNQVHVVAFYTDHKKNKKRVTLYRKKGKETDFLFHTSKKVHNRGLGRGIGERLLHSQIWTNLLSIYKMDVIEAAAKVIPYTDDEGFASKNNLKDVENLEIKKVAEGRSFGLIPTVGSANFQLIDSAVNELYEQAQLQGAAFDPIMGKEGNSGTTFRGQERTVAQGRGSHDRRRGQRAKFIEIIYRTFIIPDMLGEISTNKEFLAEFSLEELRWLADRLANNEINKRFKKMMIEEGKSPTDEELEVLRTEMRQTFLKKGNKHLMKLVAEDVKNKVIKVGINVAGKQKDLVNLSDKILSVFQYIFTNPAGFQQSMQIPALAKAFGDILEYSGLNQSDFSSLLNQVAPPPTEAVAPQEQPEAANLLPQTV